jgi:hypothetical protein
LTAAACSTAIHGKGVKLSELTHANLAFDGQTYVVFDDHDLRACASNAGAFVGGIAKRF